MFKRLILLFGVLLSAKTAPLLAQPVFQDDFSTYLAGSDASPTWNPVKGIWVVQNGGYGQMQTGYDNAALTSVFLDADFELTVRFRLLSGSPGAGLFFNSASHRSTAFSQMVRFDGDSLLFLGYFRNGEFQLSRSVSVLPVQLQSEHIFRVRVHPNAGNYSLFLDGKRVASEVPLAYRSGFFGLESSLGQVVFAGISVRKLPGAAPNRLLNWPRLFDFTPEGYPVVWDFGRREAVEIDQNGLRNVRAKAGDRLRGAAALVCLPSGQTVILDSAARRLQVFSASGKWQKAVWGAAGNPWQKPVSAAGADRGHILVLDAAQKAVFGADSALSRWQKWSLRGHVTRPWRLAARDGLVAVSDEADLSVVLFKQVTGKLAFLKKIPLGFRNVQGLAVGAHSLYVSLGTKVFQLDFQGNVISQLDNTDVNGFFAGGIALTPRGTVCVADFARGALVFLDSHLSFPEPEVRVTGGSATIFWKSLLPQTARVRFFRGKKILTEKAEELASRKHKLTVSKLKPGQVVAFQVAPTLSTLPRTSTWSVRRAFHTPFPKGKKAVRRLRAVTVIFANVLDDRRDTSHWPALPALSDSTIHWLISQIHDGIRFYWVHSRMNFWIDMDFVVVRKELKRSQVFGPENYYPPREKLLKQVLQKAGKPLRRYRGVVYLACTRAYNPTTRRFELVGRGGAFTEGIATNNRYGISWWDVTHRGHSSENNWLFTHEFNHQTDDLFLTSGHPEYWFNHFSPSLGNVARFGEHFDANAYFMNRVLPDNWLDLKWGELVWANDRDRDGIPDSDVRFPLDEKRLGSSPGSADTDGDGVRDLDEVLFSNWIVEGVGETYGYPARFPNLHNPDTDGDGLRDGEDPLPLYPVPNRWTLSETTSPQKETVRPWAVLNDPRVHAKIWVRVDSARWRLRIQIDRNRPLKIRVDANNNGWFLGRDNLVFKLAASRSGLVTKKCQVLNAAHFDRWPFDDSKLGRCVQWEAHVTRSGKNWIWGMTIFRNPAVGLRFFDGKKLGLNFGFRYRRDEQGRERYVTLFEPNSLVPIELRSH